MFGLQDNESTQRLDVRISAVSDAENIYHRVAPSVDARASAAFVVFKFPFHYSSLGLLFLPKLQCVHAFITVFSGLSEFCSTF